MTLLLLAAVIVQSHRNEVPAWKDSQIRAILAINMSTRQQMDRLSDAQIKGIPCKFEKDNEKWQLKGPKDQSWWDDKYMRQG